MGETQSAQRTGGATPLVHVSDASPGIRRRRRGKGFIYIGVDGKPVSDTATLERIAHLVIPPAYEDVWICPDPCGHLQATGRDARGRKQYRYHPAWSQRRGHDKFGRMIAFGENLPKLRRRLRHDLALPGLPRNKVLAVVVSMLGTTLIRVGNREYARDNNSYGLTTLHNRHVAFLHHGRARLQFRGKSGKRHDLVIDDVRMTRLLRRCQHLPGQMLFQYMDDEGERQPVDSGMVNDYLHDILGNGFTAKDFRTWGATVLAVAALAGQSPPESGHAMAAIEAEVTRQVAAALGNSPAVCRKSYIHPAVFRAWRDGYLARRSSQAVASQARKLETAVLRLLRHARVARPDRKRAK